MMRSKPRRLPSTRVTLALVQGLTLGWALACGRVEGPEDEGSGGTAAGGSNSGGSGTGGAAPSGGTSGIGTGGLTLGTGGSGPDEPEFDACGAPLGVFDPPCTTEDVHAYSGCSFDDEIQFTYPLDGLDVPTSEGLTMVLLPFDGGTGLGGASGDAAPHVLPVSITPVSAGIVTEGGFSITDANAALTVYVAYPSDLDDYLAERDNPQFSYAPYHEGRIAVLEGDTIIDQHRLFLDPQYVCLVK